MTLTHEGRSMRHSFVAPADPAICCTGAASASGLATSWGAMHGGVHTAALPYLSAVHVCLCAWARICHHVTHPVLQGSCVCGVFVQQHASEA